jgi:phosphotransferase system enzyme I (PtsP)
MFPMISSLDEFRLARRVVEDCLTELAVEGRPVSVAPQVGMMVELPSVVEIVDELSAEADFFSIGTNDFVQYMLGVDRTNEKVARFYVPHHPAVLRAVERVAAAASGRNRDLAVCGEMAADRRYLAYFVGVGIRTFSMDSGYLPDMQRFLSGIDLREIEAYASRLLAQSSAEEVERVLQDCPGL